MRKGKKARVVGGEKREKEAVMAGGIIHQMFVLLSLI